jgi:hypothetical protein
MVSEKEDDPVALRDALIGSKLSYTVTELIESGLLGGESAVRAAIATGEIPTVKSGPRTHRILGTDLARLIARRRRGGVS